jgi:hypothetical protein
MEEFGGRRRWIAWAAGVLAAGVTAFAPSIPWAWDCNVEIEKTVALDDDCDGYENEGAVFADDVTQELDECVAYRICVTNTSAGQPQALESVSVMDHTVAPAGNTLWFGTVAVGATECQDLGTIAGDDRFVCRDVEGTNTAIVGAQCAVDGDDACDRDGSVCEDTADVACRDAGCLTRTPGFWGNHPDVTAKLLDVTSCGLTLSETAAGLQGSVTEDLCSLGTDKKFYGSPQEAQLVRQCAAAALNLAASGSFGGSCAEALTPARYQACCGSAAACASATGSCIEDVTGFNESYDTLLDASGRELSLCHELGLGPPCDAAPLQCQTAGGNGFINAR